MKPTYAFNSFKELITISQVDKKSLKDKYSCINCNGDLIPKKGEIRQYHFAHKSGIICSKESYLHKLAKLRFEKQYRYCIENKIPFLFKYEASGYCTSCMDKKPLSQECLVDSKELYFDLTAKFDIIITEGYHNGFRADILLKSSKREYVMFIEFVVSHPCTFEKKNSGIRIIEIIIEKEEDLGFLNNNEISSRLYNVFLYNFNIVPVRGPVVTYEICDKICKTFIVDKKGNPRIIEENIFHTNQMIELGEQSYYEVLTNFKENWKYVSHPFYKLVKEVHKKDVNMKSCLVCSHNMNGKNDTPIVLCSEYPGLIIPASRALYCKDFSKV